MPYTAKDSLLSGADLLRAMEAQPEASQAMWEADSSDEESDSDTENRFSNGASDANAVPCMTIGAGTYGSGAVLFPPLLHTGIDSACCDRERIATCILCHQSRIAFWGL